jgi:hypothetical protein
MLPLSCLKKPALSHFHYKHKEGELKASRMHMNSAYLGKDYKPDIALFIDF